MLHVLRRPLPISAVVAAVCLWLATATLAHGASFLDPRLNFRTLTTTHFYIYYHQGEEPTARRLGAIAEDVWAKVGQALGLRAPLHTHVVLADQSEVANGWATPLPYNTVFITAASPAGSEYIGRNDDWLRLVFTHEFTHIVHLDRSEGWARIFRGLFGRTPIAFPNLFLPQWLIEGLAQYEESALTGDGRLHAGDYRAIEREAGRTGVAEPIDRVNGGLIDWPGGTGGYAYGLGFHEYLAREFGAARFADLARVTAATPPFTGAMAFDRVYGLSVEELWAGFKSSLESRPVAAGAEPQPTRLTYHGFTVLGPRLLPPECRVCPERIAYSIRNPQGFPTLREIDLDGGESRELAWRYLGSTAGATATDIVFDQQEFRRNVGLYSDLYRFNRRSGHVDALTHESRLQDPDVSADGRQIVAVRQRDNSRDLVVLPWEGTSVGAPRVVVAEDGTDFNAPRWSPDGRLIAVARHRLGQQSDIAIVNALSGEVRTLASAPRARLVTPTWRPDGGAVVAAADFFEDTFNLYEFDVDDHDVPPRRLTDVTGGATWPEVSRDGRTLIFVGYTTDGFDLFTLPYPSADIGAPHRGIDLTAATAVVPTITSTVNEPARRYSPWRTVAPRTWLPMVRRDNQLRLGAVITGADVLGRHLYAASATWLVDAPGDAQHPSHTQPDWDVAYTYDRWQPSFFASASSETLFSAGDPDETGRPAPITVRQREVEAGVYLPLRSARVIHRVIGSVTVAVQHPLVGGDSARRDRIGVRFGASTSSARTFGYSISPERGIAVGGTIAAIRRSLGATYDATVVTGDLRGYLPGFLPHQVLAIRAGGAADLEGHGAGQIFVLGGATPNVEVIDFGREAFSLLRGFPASSFAGSRVGVLNVDYRLPLARPQRGVGVWPVFLRTVHVAAFADVGSAWDARLRMRDLKTSLGGELSFDLVAGFSFPVTVAIGSGWGHDRRDGSNRGTVYLRAGRAF